MSDFVLQFSVYNSQLIYVFPDNFDKSFELRSHSNYFLVKFISWNSDVISHNSY